MGLYVSTTAQAIRRFGEPAAVVALARRDDVPCHTLELDLAEEVRGVLDAGFDRQQVALFYVLRPYFGQRRFGRVADPESFVAEYHRKRTRLAGLEKTLANIGDIDAVWRRDFAGQPDWRDTTDAHGWPGYLGPIGARANLVRDEHMAQVILDLLTRGERVFAVCGSSHAVKLEPALRAKAR